MESLKSLAYDLEGKIGLIGFTTSTLADIEVLLSHLVDEMDQVVHQGEEKAYYHEHQRMVRVLWNLMRHTVNELNTKHQEIDSIQEQIFKKIIKEEDKEKSPIAGNDKA